MSTAPTSAVRFGLLLLVGAVLALAFVVGVYWLGTVHPYLFSWALTFGSAVGMFVLAVARRDDPERCIRGIVGFIVSLGCLAISCYFVYGRYFGGAQ